MPLYQYECFACGKSFDRLLNMADRDGQRCDCGAEADRVITTAAVRPDGSYQFKYLVDGEAVPARDSKTGKKPGGA